MCSIGEEDFGDEGGVHAMTKDIQEESQPEILAGICQKCNKNEVVVKLSCREPECKECFLAYVQHKFRATLGSSKILPKDADVLLIFDGSPESMVLLDMLHFAQTQNTFKRLHCNVQVLHVDESCLLENIEPQRIENIQKYLSLYSFESFIVSICGKNEPINFKSLVEYQNNPTREKDEKLFVENIQEMKSLTSRQDCVGKFRTKIIKLSAEILKKEYVFLSAISSNLASTLLTNISLGRGGSTALDVSLFDDRIPNLKIIRPLKDLNTIEVENYLNLNDMSPIINCFYGTDGAVNASIQNLTTNFILNLQKGFASTVSTVFRVGDKIAAKATPDTELETLKSRCKFCHSQLDYLNSTTLLAIEFSRLVSENTSKDNLENTKKLEINARNNLHGKNAKSLADLCHGCRNIYHDCLDQALLS